MYIYGEGLFMNTHPPKKPTQDEYKYLNRNHFCRAVLHCDLLYLFIIYFQLFLSIKNPYVTQNPSSWRSELAVFTHSMIMPGM